MNEALDPAGPGLAAEPPALAAGAHVHLVGAGGAGMSALGTVLLERGHPVSGSDLTAGRQIEALRALGAEITIGHRQELPAGVDVVVVSTAVTADNPEIAAAHAAGLAVWRRAELLAALLVGRRGVLVSGTHGKTTTTAMLTVALQQAGLDPTFAIGGTLHDAGTSAHHGSGHLFVAEADESDGSFLVYRPEVAVVTNVELDHHDHWGSETELAGAFATFLARRRQGGIAVCGVDDAGGRRLAATAHPPVVTYGLADDAQVRAHDLARERGATVFRVTADRTDLDRWRVRLPGAHNVVNALAVVAVAWALGLDLAAVRQALASFAGTHRRFQQVGHRRGVTVVDDYAHHPAEVRAVLAAARQSQPRGRIVAVFQPHLYSRTLALADDFGVALAGADMAVVTDVYGAREQPVPGVSGKLVADAVSAAGGRVSYVPNGVEIPEAVAELVEDSDLVLTLGAGDITETGPQILQRVEQRRG
jgi:UDP-N-acetylmuramate--alanine ligase